MKLPPKPAWPNKPSIGMGEFVACEQFLLFSFHFVFASAVGLILSLCFSCGKVDDKKEGIDGGKINPIQQSESSSNLSSEDSLISGIPIADPGEPFNFDSILKRQVVPLNGTPKSLSAHPNRRPVGTPKVIQIPEQLTVMTPGENDVPMPKVIPAKGRVVPALQPKPVLAHPLRVKDEAIANIQYLEIDQGLGTDNVGAILEDSRGYLWFGTSNGAIRYDGKWMTHYGEQEGLGKNAVRSIVEDKRGNIWFATFGGGVVCYDGNNFHHFTEKEGMSKNMLYCMMEDSKGNLWFGTYSGGVIRYDGTNFTIFTEKEGLPDKSVLSLMEDSKGGLWFGTVKGGVSRYDGERFTNYTIKEGLCSNLVYSIEEDRQGNIWFATYQGASRFDGKSFTNYTAAEGLMGDLVSAVLVDNEGILWFANSEGSKNSVSGLSRFDGKTFAHYTEAEGLGSNRIGPVAEDKRGNLWLATNNGVTRFAPGSFVHYTGKTGLKHEQMAYVIKEDNKSNLWVGTWLGGLVSFDREQFTYLSQGESSLNRIVNHLVFDNQGNIWSDMGGRALSFFDGKRFEYYLPADVFKNTYKPLLWDSKGALWFQANHGLVRRNEMGSVLFSNPETFNDNSILTMHEDPKGQLWLGMDWGGVVRYDGRAFTRFSEKEGLSGDRVKCILTDKQGALWVGTWEGGLNRYDGTRFMHFTEKEGLGSNLVYAMAEDSAGNIWASRYHGISILVPEKNWPSLKADQPAELGQIVGGYCIINYDLADGLKGKNYHTLLIDSKNCLWLGGSSGMSMLDIGKFKPIVEPPKLRFGHIEIDQQYLDFRKLRDTAYQNAFPLGKRMSSLVDSVVPFANYPPKMTLPSDLNHLTFYFSAIDWAAPHKIQYSYLIEKIDKAWSPPQVEAKAEFRNLPSGRHTIKVRAIGAGQIWSDPVAYHFTIQAPWYRRWWAYLIYLLAAGGLLLAIRHYELKRKLAKAEAHRTKELNEVKSRLYTNITHEFRTPLTIILGLVSKLKTKVDHQSREDLHIIERNGNQVLLLVNQLLQMAKLESGSLPVNLVQGDVKIFVKYLLDSFYSLAESKQITLHFNSPHQELMMDFDPVKLQEIVSNLLSNAIKFTPAGGTVSLGISAESKDGREFLTLLIKDTGKGIPPGQLERIFDRFYQVDESNTRTEEGTGIGLALTRELVKLLKGEISVESTIGVGSTFMVNLPVIRQAPLLAGILNAPPESGLYKALSPKKGQDAVIKEGMPCILIIEDNADLRQYLSSMLRPNFRLLQAPNGREGLEMARREMPDIIISDVMMPEMNGFEVCRQLKDDIATCHIPIILLTAKADAESKLQGLEEGADVYLPKPFDEKELEIRLRKLLEAREKLRHYYTSPTFLLGQNNDQAAAISYNDDKLIRSIQQFVEHHLADKDLTAESMAKHLNMSYMTSFRKVQALTGLGVKEYIQHIRLQKAANWLIAFPDRPIHQIAEEAGFSSTAFFSRQFKKAVGMTPTEYRTRRDLAHV